MADEIPPVQTEPSPAPTAGEQPPVVEAAPVSTTPPAESPSDSAGKVGGGVEGYLAEKEKALKGTKASAPAQAASTTPVVEVETPPAAIEGSPPVETPPVIEGAAPVEAPPVEAPPVEEDRTPDRIRIGSVKGSHLIVAAANIAREEDIPFAEAFERVRPKPEATPPLATTEPAAAALRSRADVEAEIATARTERRAAADATDKLEAGSAGKMVAAEEKIEALQEELGQIEDSEIRVANEQERAEQTKFSSDVVKSKTQASDYWPDCAVENSEFSKRMLELSDQYEADPSLSHHVYQADAPFFFASLVAKELGVAPVHLQKKPAAAVSAATQPVQPSTSSATRPAPVTQRAVVRPVQPAAGPASGAARTTQEAPKVDLGIEKIRSVTDYENVKKKVLAGAQ